VKRAWVAVLLLALAGQVRGDEKTTAVVIDRSGSVSFGDRSGDGRVAVAFALALSARPGGRVVVLASGAEPAEGDATKLEGLEKALHACMVAPRPGGDDLVKLLREAVANGTVLAYTSDDLDVIDAEGHAPEDVVAAAGSSPDRKAVNEAARALVAKIGAAKVVALRTSLPAAARSVDFLAPLGAQIVELEAPLEAARGLVKDLVGLDLDAPVKATLDGGKGTIAASGHVRVALLGEKALKVSAPHALALDEGGRAWLVDAEGPVEVEGEAGSGVSALVAPRAEIEFTASAFRLANGAIHVVVEPKDRSLVLAARAGDMDLKRGDDGVLRGRLVALDGDKLAVSVAGSPVDVTVARAVLALEAGEVPIANGTTKLVAKGPGLPAELLPTSVSVTLACGKELRKVELARKGDAYSGDVVLAEGTWSLQASAAGDLAVELAAPLVAKPAAVLSAVLVEAGKVRGGDVSVVVDLALSPALARPATPTVTSFKGTASVEGTLQEKGRFTVSLTGTEPGRNELYFKVPLGRDAEAPAKLELELEGALPWKPLAAAGAAALGLLWVLVVRLRKRALLKRFAEKQLRGLGSNGKISYERYLLIEHREDRFSAIAPPGATAARIEIGRDGRIRARALEGSTLTGVGGQAGAELLLVHETCFLVTRELYRRRWVYLDREPTAEELMKKYVEDAPSYIGEESRDSDVFVLLDEQQNMAPPSQRITPVESAKLPQVRDVVGNESDETIVMTSSSEDKVLDDEESILDPGSSDEVGSDDLIEDD
jgi:hypothetical protein